MQLPRLSSAAPAASPGERWQITVQFHTEVLRNGMDPLSFIRYLGTLGEIVELQLLTERLPAAEEFDAEACYLGFEIELASSETQQRIEGAFEFVRDDCTLHVRPKAPAASEVVAEKRETADTKEGKTAKSSDRSLRVDGDKLDSAHRPDRRARDGRVPPRPSPPARPVCRN